MIESKFTHEKELFSPGHSACAGCGVTISFRNILRALGKDIIIVNATGCSEIFSTCYPKSAWRVPYIHSLFENVPAVASGVVRALRAKGNEHTQVVCIAGDGATYDIGFGALSGMLERNEDVLYICYDNEAYMNTGVQRSSSTPFGASTTTSPAGKKIHGKQQTKKPIVEIAAAHGIPYAASASIANLPDLANKLKKAVSIRGARFLSVHTPCVPGWGYSSEKTVALSKLAVETGAWVLFEIENGKFKLNANPAKRKPLAEYLTFQKRFKHLSQEEIAQMQKQLDAKWETLAKWEKCD
ncbi:MAG: pyruvate synthase subunit PorB [Candidatus Micrarchaeota archaeon]